MTLNELKSSISKSQHPDWFKNVVLKLKFSSVGLSQNLESFSTIYKYFEQQKNGWNNLANIPPELQTSATFFKKISKQLEDFIKSASALNDNQLNNQWNNIKGGISDIQLKSIYTYDCPETEFLIKVNVEQPEYTSEIFNFINAYSNNQSISVNSSKSFIAYTMAYEFIQRDFTRITERKNAEKSSINRIRNDFSEYLSKSEAHLNEYLDIAKRKSEEYAISIDKTRESKEIAFDAWYNTSNEKHKNFVSETLKNRTDLEKTYRELLRLKAPAEYWMKRAIILKRDGKKYVAWLVALVVFTAGLLYFLLRAISNDSIVLIFENTGTAIKTSIIFITFISFIAYGIKILAKLSFSAFHLARDAEEREQLIYLYLALKKDGNIEESDRQLVLQSLFSRSDTGLLKDDSSPSMPGSTSNIVEKIMMK